MTRICASAILFTFSLALLLFPLLEVGHELLHQFKNNIHEHAVTSDHHHNLADHHIHQQEDQGFSGEPTDGINFISLLFGLSHPVENNEGQRVGTDADHPTMFVCIYSPITLTPPTPPPLG